MPPPRLILVLSENWTLTSPRDLRSLVRIAVEAVAADIPADKALKVLSASGKLVTPGLIDLHAHV